VNLPDTAFSADLYAAVQALYRLAPDHAPPGLMVCHCPVCMTPETKAQIVATPVRDLPPELIREYTNSAHGVPDDPDDLTALLPRYLDLIAQDIEVDWNGVGADLRRFGEARATLPGFPPPAMAQAMDSYADALIGHFGALQAAGADAVQTPWMLVEILITGGWSVATVTAALDALFAHPTVGRAALAGFLDDMARALRDGALVIWALHRYAPDAWPALAAWLEALLATDSVTELLTDPALPEDRQVWLTALIGLRGCLAQSIATD
jgi:hypothetical protein